MKDGGNTVLVYGYGNPGRLDDGLGPAAVELLEKAQIKNVSLDSDYQLTVEDAADVAQHDFVVFVDADVSGPAPFWFGAVEPEASLSFSSHSVKPEALLDMARELLGGSTKGYILGIRGYEFNEFGERLSAGAQDNLKNAVSFMLELLEGNDFEQRAKEGLTRFKKER